MNQRIFKENGFGLIELTMLIVVIGIFASVVMQSMTSVIEDVRQVKTGEEMEDLVNAIRGNPKLTNIGIRSDFGYFGDVGAFPPNLDALVSNPGGYGTWDGPYLNRRFSEDISGFKKDEWNTDYSYVLGSSISSTGSGTTITSKLTDATSDYLLNTLNGTIKDQNDSLPGIIYQDSVKINIVVPNGSGGLLTKSVNPNAAGDFLFDSLPAGKHLVEAIFEPNADTLTRYITILPKHKSSVSYNFAQSYFGIASPADSMIKFVASSDTIFSNSACNNFSFWIENQTGSDIAISNLTATWSSPTAYYQQITWDGTTKYNAGSPGAGSGELATFTVADTIANNSSIKIELLAFKTAPPGAPSSVDMSNTTFTILLSDGSTFDISTGACQ